MTLYQGEDVAEGLSQDISMSGINILVKHRYEQGDTLELDIRSPNKDFQSYAGSPPCVSRPVSCGERRRVSHGIAMECVF